ncbi:MAG: DUF3726 domain-containing protein [Pseudomonadota bacterium]
MNYSLNEIEALAKRAARGAGLSWGMAEEAAKATRWLAAHDLAGPALLADVLTRNDRRAHAQVAPTTLESTWTAPGDEMCPLAAGAALNDCAEQLSGGQSIEMSNLSCPLLVVPFAAWAALHLGQTVTVRWGDLRIETDGDGLWVDDPAGQINAPSVAKVTCASAPQRQDEPRRPGTRGKVPTEVNARLNAFAGRTYAPATEASRRLGAGAGVSDND